MKIHWQIEPDDVRKVLKFFELYRKDPLVIKRTDKNLSNERPLPTKEVFWHRMVSCLLTTQQRSGPTSPITRFIESEPFPLRLSVCSQQIDLAQYAQKVISDFGAIRRANKIADEISANLTYLRNGGWDETFGKLRMLQTHTSPKEEREVAEFVDLKFRGFGPKQSRNLLQWLGLTRFEIPIDSRITKWLNELEFPVELNSTGLSDSHYYNFVSDGFQTLCAACDIVPCLLDAAIFVSFDLKKSTEESVVA